ncbi:type III pantothenate kinase [Lentibacillus kapialis]|uniref:Type III pantothenate kinase n=1 Tax=Lentibacillus kapialis TaxID=340214 RepID=A0A917UZL9_9BACI|nr:type III pantothenate kinase [Lentibacillus kapialis]GGK01212.1 type III pantothenate kinase [Lentibacillus kapialis]
MLFVLDAGNTNTVLGVFKDESLIHEWRIKTDRHKTEDDYAVLVKTLLEHEDLSFSDISGVIISSVVPPMMFSLEKMCTKYFHLEPLIIGKESVHSYLKMAYPNPKEIGADRIVNAVGAIKEYGAPLIIIDFGTATTFCYINQEKAYHGGLITPGILISMEALNSKASKLPKIELDAPESVIGRTTEDAMQSGVFYGYVAQVDGIVKRMKQEMGTKPIVIATGGLASLFTKASETIDYADKYLTLKGLHLIYKQNVQTEDL